uniref:Pleckstrin homology domain-containing family A member 2-like n=1 Tax=Sinocyclocheilus rhinocerous TaxID=307959 RepID=A0A673MFN4_9TELE
MPYLDRQNRTCGFLDIEENENSDKFYRRYFILDTHENFLLWYMDNPQNLPPGTVSVGSLRLKMQYFFFLQLLIYINNLLLIIYLFICLPVINALSRRYFLQANDAIDSKEWVIALNNATKITVPKASPVAQSSDATNVSNPSQSTSRQAYKTEIVGGVVVHTPVQQVTDLYVFFIHLFNLGSNEYESVVLSSEKSWKRRFFILDDQTVSYYKSEMEPLRSIRLRDVLKVNEDLLSRDNLFEIITSTRTFYIQADTPEDMKGWIKDIASKIQDFRGPSKVNILNIRFQSSLTSLIVSCQKINQQIKSMWIKKSSNLYIYIYILSSFVSRFG